MRRVLVVCYIMDSPLNTPRKLLINDQVLGSIKPIQIKKVYSYNNLWYQASKRLLAEVRRIRMMLPNPKSCRHVQVCTPCGLCCHCEHVGCFF